MTNDMRPSFDERGKAMESEMSPALGIVMSLFAGGLAIAGSIWMVLWRLDAEDVGGAMIVSLLVLVSVVGTFVSVVQSLRAARWDRRHSAGQDADRR